MELVLNDEKKPTLCLNMIVKNESKIITRLFDSIISIIDCYCICDTGSTDDTIKIMYEYFHNKGIPGKIFSQPFVNFCFNRNVSLNACLGMSDFILLIDADMKLEIKNFNKIAFKEKSKMFDCFHILQGNQSFFYQNIRIVKNNGFFKYIGVTHEYVDFPSNTKVSGFDKNELFITDLGDGGSKENKFNRDISLLLDGIKDEPNNARYHFYLANTYHDIGKYEEAIDIYKKRIDLGGWVEEVWYSFYRIGLCYKKLNNFVNALYFWLEGYNYYPERLEGLYEVIQYYRLTSKHKLGEMIYSQARQILNLNKNRNAYLFLHDDVYTNKIYYEFTVFAAYVGIKNINFEIIKILNYSTDESEVDNLLKNMKFYKDILIPKKTIVFDDKSEIFSIINDENMKFISSSSCLIPCKTTNGYHMNVRYVNYQIFDKGEYLCGKHIISLNKYVKFDKEFNITGENWFELIFENKTYVGVEDVRIFNDIETNDFLFIGTGLHKNNTIGIVSGKYNIEQLKLEGNELSQKFNNSNCEKNWVFCNFNNSTHVIYQWFPLKICKINKETNNIDVIIEKQMPKLFSKIRGSTCGFQYVDKITNTHEIWFINHIVSHETPRHYYHIISIFDINMNLLRYSAPFKFEGDPIEYCLSIIVENEQVLINYSNWDRTTKIGIYDKKYIDSIVKYIDT
jgi:tetratricopeptide (TPR) repeat protein